MLCLNLGMLLHLKLTLWVAVQMWVSDCTTSVIHTSDSYFDKHSSSTDLQVSFSVHFQALRICSSLEETKIFWNNILRRPGAELLFPYP